MTKVDTMKGDLSKLHLRPDEKTPVKRRRRSIGGIVSTIVGLALVAGLATVYYLSRNQRLKRPETTPAARLDKRIGTLQAPGRPTVKSVKEVAAGGYVEAKCSAVLLPGRDGVIAAVHVTLGQRVKKGDLLLELDTRRASAEVAMAMAELAQAKARLDVVRSGARKEELAEVRAELEAAKVDWQRQKRELERLEKLAPSGAVAIVKVEQASFNTQNALARVKSIQAREQLLQKGSRKEEIQAAQAEVERAQAALRLSKACLDLSYLRAPFDGVVVRIDLEPGEVVSLMSGQGARSGIEIADIAELRVKVDIPERRIGLVSMGATAEVVVDALEEIRLQGVVVDIAPTAKRQSNTVEVAVRIVNPPPLLRPNMSARVAIKAKD